MHKVFQQPNNRKTFLRGIDNVRGTRFLWIEELVICSQQEPALSSQPYPKGHVGTTRGRCPFLQQGEEVLLLTKKYGFLAARFFISTSCRIGDNSLWIHPLNRPLFILHVVLLIHCCKSID